MSLAATKGGDGNYHISQDWWQSWEIVGYNKIYDFVFDSATSMAPATFPFKYNKEDYILWAWKGDYVNLGAGAELGIYYGGGPHWKTGKDYAMPMTLTLKYKGNEIISYDPKRDDPKGQDTDKWWITGFDPSTPDVLAEDLEAIFTLNFSESEEMKGMYRKFKKTWDGKDARWDFTREYHPTFTFGEER